jgi:hypothetical protein
MKRRGFGYVAPPKNRGHQKERANTDWSLAKIKAVEDRAEDDASVVVERKQTEPDMRSLAQRIGLPEGCNLDAEIARRKEAAIADPNSPQSIASKRRAAAVAEQYGLDADVERLYALFLRTCDLHRPRPTAVTMADRYPSQRFNVQVETTGPGGPPIGFAHFYPGRVDPYLVLGLEPLSLYIRLSPKPLIH